MLFKSALKAIDLNMSKLNQTLLFFIAAFAFSSCQDWQPKLDYYTDAGPVDNGGCAGYFRQIQWKIPPPVPAGYIIQKIEFTIDETPCPAPPISITGPSGPTETATTTTTTSSPKKMVYWEAWEVTNGASYPGPDEWSNTLDKKQRTGIGTLTIKGVARFFVGISLPSDFVPDNNSTYARSLPSTTKEPDFWKNPTGLVSPPVEREVIIKWDCCVTPHVRTVVKDSNKKGTDKF